jgi:phosphogluconate dehydratase
VPAAEWAARERVAANLEPHQHGVGRDLFAGMRQQATTAEEGAMTFAHPLWTKQ